MSESHRDNDKSSNNNFSHSHRNSKDDIDRHDRKRSHNDSENTDAKVFIRNVPTKKVTDDELLNFFKPYGKISDIQVFKDHIFVQYTRVEDANKLLKDAKIPLLFKGNKLDVLSAREIRSTSVKSTSTDRSSKSHDRNSHRSSSNYEPQRKRFVPREQSSLVSVERSDDRTHVPVSRSNSHQSSNDSMPLSHQIPYAILTGPKDTNALVDCQIIIVNARQRDYAEEIEARLSSQGIITSIILLREDFTLTEAIENAARLQCLYGIIAMPMHEERRTASFHILHGQTEEHRNLTLEDGIHIIATNYSSYKRRIHNNDVNSYRSSHDPISYTNSSPPSDSRRQLNNHTQEEITPPVLHLGDKLPLSMLLCLLADGRQLTLEEIDRVLVYLLEKKAKMLTLPAGTLPPLPAQYATTNNHQTGPAILSDTRTLSTSDPSSGKSIISSLIEATPASIAEQIRQIFSSNIIKPNSSAGERISPPLVLKTSMNTLSDNLKIERTVPSQVTNNIKDSPKDYVGHHNQPQQQQNAQSSFSYAKSEPVSITPPAFNYTPSSVSNTGTIGSYPAPNFSSYNPATSSLPLNSSLKGTTPVTVPNFASQPSTYFYPVPTQSVYQPSLNSTAVNTAAAIFQAYSQFNVQPTGAPSIVNQQMATQQQQQQIRK